MLRAHLFRDGALALIRIPLTIAFGAIAGTLAITALCYFLNALQYLFTGQ